MAVVPGAQAKGAPVAKMTTGKITILLVLALIFDALKFMATQLWFFGPALIGLATSVGTGSKVAGAVVGALGVGGAALTGLGEGLEVLGIVLGVAIGFFGWLVLITVMTSMRISLFHSRNFLSLVGGFIVSELPFIDALPSFTVSTWRIISAERKADKEAKKKYEVQLAAGAKRQQRVAVIMQKQQLAQEAAEAQAAQEEQEAAAADMEEEQAQEEPAEPPILAQPRERVPRTPLADVPSL
jgi:hypothetical protein